MINLHNQYENFLKNFVQRAKTNDMSVHLHPAPKMLEVYERILTTLSMPDLEEEPNTEEEIDAVNHWICSSMDVAVQFAFYLAEHGIKYEYFEKCSCFTLTAEDLESLKNE